MNESWFRWIVLFCGVVFILAIILFAYSYSAIGKWNVSKPIEVLRVGDFWLGLKEGGDFTWKASNSSELKFDLSYFFGNVKRVDSENSYVEVMMADKQKVRVQLISTLVSSILFQIPVGKNYLSLHHLNEKVSDLRENELVFVFGRVLSLDLTSERTDDRIIFGASEIVRKR
jgi:hypothetical protein